MTVDEVDKSPTYANMKMLGFTDYTSTGTSPLSSPEELYKEVHINMAQFREPPPYPGHSKQLNQPGLRQSFSGSETSTDVSVSSTENLSSSQRQEPQGEETQAQPNYPYDMNNSEYSILARLGMPTSAMDLPSQSAPAIYVTGNGSNHGPHFATGPSGGNVFYNTSSESSGSSGSGSCSKVTWQESSLGGSKFPNTPTNMKSVPPSSSVPTCSYNTNTLYANYPFHLQGGMDAVPFTGQMLPQYIQSLPPPPEYPGMTQGQGNMDRLEARRSYETIGKPDIPGSRSQPDLTHFWESHSKPVGLYYPGSEGGSEQSIEQSFGTETQYQDVEQIAAQATKMVEVLSDENRMLREKLSMCDRKVSKLQKFELEIQKVHEAYESLVKSSRKREGLEVMMKKKLGEELKKLRAQNDMLRDRLEAVGIKVTDAQLTAQIEQADSSMSTLIAKHKELLALKERQDIEFQAQLTTIQEQRAQIEILRSVQANVLRLEEECRKQQVRSDYEDQIQQELVELKEAYEKKEQTETLYRQKLEKEIEHCRQHHAQGTGNLARKPDVKREQTTDLKRMLDEKEAKILQLEKEVIQWKEQHLEESIRKLKLQGSESEPRLPMYEQASTVVNTETLINEAKTEKLRQMEEIYQANCKVAELEAKVKSLQSQLSEKEAMVRVYQRSPMTRSSSVHTIYCSPLHSPRPSLIATGSLSRQNSQDAAAFREFKHKKTGSTSALETSSRLSQDDLFEKIRSLQSESKTDSDTEEAGDKNIWQV